MKGTLVISAIAHAAFFAAVLVPAFQGRSTDSLDVINVSLLGGGGGGSPKPAVQAAAEPAKQVEPVKEAPSKMDYKSTKPKTSKKETSKTKSSKSGSSSSKAASASGGSGGGSGTGKGTGTGAGSGIKVDDQDFRFAYYLEVIRERIGYNWSPPVVFGSPSEVVATVFFKISRDGTVSDEKVEKSSSQEIFDRAALRAVQLSDPLPPLPAGFRGKSLGVHFEFQHTPG